MNKYNLIIGSHVSYKNPGYLKGAIQEGLSYEANAIMIYTGAPQNTKRTPINSDDVALAVEYAKEKQFNLNNIIVHAPYIFNAANPKTTGFACQFLISELKRTKLLHGNILVLHPGNALTNSLDVAIQTAADTINHALKETSSDQTKIAIETMSGKGTEICVTFEQVAKLLSLIHDKKRIGVCFDTCHVHDAGYNLSDQADHVMEQFDKIIGLDKILCLHINNSKNILGARKDRHANLKNGEIKLEALISIIYHKKLNNIPKILETPYVENLPPYKEEIALIRSYLK